jgi:hypothetical protein
MKCFLRGIFGTVVVLVIVAVVYPQYSDYQAAAETSMWLYHLDETKKLIAANAERNQSLIGSGVNVTHPKFSSKSPEYVEITQDGIILVQGGREGQLVVLMPNLKAGKVKWICRGGSKKVTTGCRDEL